ncbi:MAG: hypothetical protein WBV06_17165 [Acidimicrobiia bacterium]
MSDTVVVVVVAAVVLLAALVVVVVAAVVAGAAAVVVEAAAVVLLLAVGAVVVVVVSVKSPPPHAEAAMPSTAMRAMIRMPEDRDDRADVRTKLRYPSGLRGVAEAGWYCIGESSLPAVHGWNG